jgi:predicted RNase H-like HicB family nuclease
MALSATEAGAPSFAVHRKGWVIERSETAFLQKRRWACSLFLLCRRRFYPLPKPCKLAEHMEYAVIFEKTSTGWSAYVPDLPGLGVADSTYEATEQLIREGITFHIEGLLADGLPIPEPTTA